jgi:hypothetical protein
MVWRRRQRPHLSRALSEWAQSVESAEGAYEAVASASATDFRSATRALPPPVREAIARDIERLFALFTRVTGSARARVNFSAVQDDHCRKFHSDYRRYRLICTYAGPGTEWLPDHAVERTAMQPSTDCPIEANRAIVRSAAEVRRAASFEVLLLKGEQHGKGRGAVHRSPPLEATGQTRVLLTLSGLDSSVRRLSDARNPKQ